MQCQLRLQDGAELLPVRDEVPVLGVLAEGSVFLHLDVIAVEHLVLPVGADQTTDEGEDEHDGQNGETHHRQPVAEEPLGHQRTGGQHLDAAVIAEGVILPGRVILRGRIVLSRVLFVELIGTAAGIGARHSLTFPGLG